MPPLNHISLHLRSPQTVQPSGYQLDPFSSKARKRRQEGSAAVILSNARRGEREPPDSRRGQRRPGGCRDPLSRRQPRYRGPGRIPPPPANQPPPQPAPPTQPTTPLPELLPPSPAHPAHEPVPSPGSPAYGNVQVGSNVDTGTGTSTIYGNLRRGPTPFLRDGGFGAGATFLRWRHKRWEGGPVHLEICRRFVPFESI